jgi:hypothetical protein
LQPEPVELLVLKNTHQVGAETDAHAGCASQFDRRTPGLEHLAVLLPGDRRHAELGPTAFHRVVSCERRHHVRPGVSHDPGGIGIQEVGVLDATHTVADRMPDGFG